MRAALLLCLLLAACSDPVSRWKDLRLEVPPNGQYVVKCHEWEDSKDPNTNATIECSSTLPTNAAK